MPLRRSPNVPRISPAQWMKRSGWKIAILCVFACVVLYMVNLFYGNVAGYDYSTMHKAQPVSAMLEPRWGELQLSKIAAERSSVRNYIAAQVYDGRASAVLASEYMRGAGGDNGQKLIRDIALDLEVENPAECLDKIRHVVESM